MSSRTTNLGTRISVLDDFFVSQRYLLLSQIKYQEFYVTHSLQCLCVIKGSSYNYFKNFKYQGKLFVWQAYSLESTHANNPKPYLHDRSFKKVRILIYASKRCQCEIYINFYEDYNHFMPSCVVTYRWAFSVHIYIYIREKYVIT
jgi:hypothetical protein